MAQFPLIDQASLVMIPGAYKEGKIYSQLPTDGSGDFTYTRGTDTATRVNENGLIEKGYENTLLQSNNWAQSDSQYEITGGEAGYDGTNDAWLVNKLAAAYFSKDALVLTGVMTISFYAKAGSLDRIFVFIGGDAARFDLTNGTAVSAGGNSVSQNIELVSGTTDWYRCSIVLNKTSTQNLLIKPQNSSNQDVTGTIYIQDAQLNQGLVAYPYLETTTVPVYAGLTDNMPRLDYTDATCPSLLLEPSRTNLIKQSEWMGGLTLQEISVDVDNTVSPEGYANVSKITSLNISSKITNSGIPYVAGTTYTFSAWVKNIDASTVQFLWYDGSSNRVYKENEVNTETFTRISFSFTPSNTISGQIQIARDLPAGQSFYVYGAQLEEGSYPTSYIPTYGSAQTRAADNPFQLDVTNLTSTYNTLYAEFEVISITNQGKIALSDNGQTNRMTIYQNGGGVLLLLNANGSAQTVIQASNVLSVGTNYKVIAKHQDGSHALFINGTKIGEESSTTPTGLNRLRYGNEANSISSQKFSGNIKQTLLFPVALTDQECIDLTTL